MKSGARATAGFKFRIVEKGILSSSQNGWTNAWNLGCWNGKEAKFDIRDWAPDHEQNSKGITLSAAEIKQPRSLLNE